MNIFEKTMDGSGFPPRDIQKNFFKFLTKHIDDPNCHIAMQGPPGIGKSYIARTIQRVYAPDSVIITPNNVLVDQYLESYPDLNGVKGKDWYDDINDYHKVRDRALTEATVFNPLSYYYFYLRNTELQKPSIVIVDEAHKLADMLLLIISKSYSCKYYNIPIGLSEFEFLNWLNTMLKKMAPLMKTTRPNKSQEKLIGRVESLYLLRDYLKDNLKQVKISYEYRKVSDKSNRRQMYLVVQPLQLPISLLTTIFGPKAKFILMSGSITKFDMKELFPKNNYAIIEYEPLAPLANRPIYKAALPRQDRKNYAAQAKRIREIYKKHNKPNTLIHVSYADAERFKFLLKDLPIITHTKDDKQVKLDLFKKKGGILLASGMAEGVDLPGDYCRLIIIPKLLFPNIGDVAIKKRMALANGQFWYKMTTMMTTVQQVGRGVRGPKDQCDTYVLDPLFEDLVLTTGKYLTTGFKESVKCEN